MRLSTRLPLLRLALCAFLLCASDFLVFPSPACSEGVSLEAAGMLDSLLVRATLLPKAEALGILDSLQMCVHRSWFRQNMAAAHRGDTLQLELAGRLTAVTGDSAFLEAGRAASRRLRALDIRKLKGGGPLPGRQALLDSLRVVREVFSRHDMIQQVILNDLYMGEFSTVFDQPDYQTGLSCFLEALDASRKHGYAVWESHALIGIGRLFERLEHFDDARGCFSKALDAARSSIEDEAYFRAMYGLARMDLRAGKPAEGLARLAEVSTRTGKELKESHLSINLFYGNARTALGEYDAARKHYEIAREWARERGFHPVELYTTLCLGLTCEEEGDTAGAQAYFEEIMADPAACHGPALWQAPYRLGCLAEARGDRDEALGKYIDAITCIEDYREVIALDLLQFSYLENRMLPYEKLLGLLSGRSEREGAREVRETALEYADAAKINCFPRQMSEPVEGVHELHLEQLLGRKKQILEELTSLRKEYLREGVSPAERERLLLDMQKLKTSLTEVRLGIELSRKSTSEEAVSTDLTTIDAVRANILDSSTCIMEYFVGDEATYAWLIRRDGISMQRLQHFSSLNNPVLLYRELLSQNEASFPVKLGERLYADLISPFEESLAGMENLIIVADGVLCYLPFEALPLKVRGDQDERPRFLIEEFNVSYAPSLAALAHFGQRESARTGPGETLLAIGDPRGEAGSIFSSLKGFFDEGRDREEETSPFTSGSEGFPRLKHSGDEVRRIAETFPENRRKILVESAAREETVKQELRLPWDIVHFAVHGIYDDYSPELSGIVLSSSEDRDDDGFLLADEIRDMELDASLVVLSGCETGLGRFVRGEGVVGLSRALFEAGASSILASLWGIGDESTAEFMEEFYRTYRGGAGKSSALSAVKRNMIQEGKPVSVWAPFVLLGDPR